jgi:hypothetical protein
MGFFYSQRIKYATLIKDVTFCNMPAIKWIVRPRPQEVVRTLLFIVVTDMDAYKSHDKNIRDTRLLKAAIVILMPEDPDLIRLTTAVKPGRIPCRRYSSTKKSQKPGKRVFDYTCNE